MNGNKLVRQCHRWLSIAFTTSFIANLVTMAIVRGMPSPWVTYAPLLLLVLLLFTGLYLFVLPYVATVPGEPRSSTHVAYQICGGPDDGFTSAEILAHDEHVARVYELESGWHIEMQEFEKLRHTQLISTILEAQRELQHYVNRKGTNPPDGLTRAGASLWLMQRDDGKGFTI